MSRARKSSDLPEEHRALRRDTAERLEAIVEAAERAAAGVIDDAEAQARRYLAQARTEADLLAGGRVSELADLLDALLGQAVSLRQEAERLQATLEEARERLGAEGQSEGPVQTAQPEAPLLRAVPEREEDRRADPDRRADASGARLLATQMAVAGSSREEIELRLRNGFEIEDPDAILDAILGPED